MKINWGFGIAIVYLVFISCMIMLAIKSSNQKLDLVSDNYYEEAVNYQKRIVAGNNALNNNSGVSIKYIEDRNILEITASKINGKIESGALTFYKPDKATEDFKLSFSIDSSGRQIIPLKKMAHGYWKVTATWVVKEKSFYEEEEIYIP